MHASHCKKQDIVNELIWRLGVFLFIYSFIVPYFTDDIGPSVSLQITVQYLSVQVNIQKLMDLNSDLKLNW